MLLIFTQLQEYMVIDDMVIFRLANMTVSLISVVPWIDQLAHNAERSLVVSFLQ